MVDKYQDDNIQELRQKIDDLHRRLSRLERSTSLSYQAEALYGLPPLYSDSYSQFLSSEERPKFTELNNEYNNEIHDCPDISPSPNQCAVRLSKALIGVGISMDIDYEGNLCRHGYARGAQDLAAFLRIKWGTRDFGFEAPGSIPEQIKSVKGIILFANIPDFRGQGHIDLWNGSETRTGEYWNANPIWLWKLSD